jgi:hypothetical protein
MDPPAWWRETEPMNTLPKPHQQSKNCEDSFRFVGGVVKSRDSIAPPRESSYIVDVRIWIFGSWGDGVDYLKN